MDNWHQQVGRGRAAWFIAKGLARSTPVCVKIFSGWLAGAGMAWALLGLFGWGWGWPHVDTEKNEVMLIIALATLSALCSVISASELRPLYDQWTGLAWWIGPSLWIGSVPFVVVIGVFFPALTKFSSIEILGFDAFFVAAPIFFLDAVIFFLDLITSFRIPFGFSGLRAAIVSRASACAKACSRAPAAAQAAFLRLGAPLAQEWNCREASIFEKTPTRNAGVPRQGPLRTQSTRPDNFLQDNAATMENWHQQVGCARAVWFVAKGCLRSTPVVIKLFSGWLAGAAMAWALLSLLGWDFPHAYPANWPVDFFDKVMVGVFGVLVLWGSAKKDQTLYASWTCLPWWIGLAGWGLSLAVWAALDAFFPNLRPGLFNGPTLVASSGLLSSFVILVSGPFLAWLWTLGFRGIAGAMVSRGSACARACRRAPGAAKAAALRAGAPLAEEWSEHERSIFDTTPAGRASIPGEGPRRI